MTRRLSCLPYPKMTSVWKSLHGPLAHSSMFLLMQTRDEVHPRLVTHRWGLPNRLTFIDKFLQPEFKTEQVAIALPEVVLEK